MLLISIIIPAPQLIQYIDWTMMRAKLQFCSRRPRYVFYEAALNDKLVTQF